MPRRKSPQPYPKFIEFVKEISDLEMVMSLLDWDQETYMPPGAINMRARQTATVSGILHDWTTSKKMGRYLERLTRPSVWEKLNEVERVNVREIKRVYDKQTKLPRELVMEIARTTSMSQNTWAIARKNNDFKKFLPYLIKMVELKQKVAEAIGYEDTPYDPLLDDFEPYAKTKEVARVLENLRKKLVPIARKIIDSSDKPDEKIFLQKYPIGAQKRFALRVLRNMGYDFKRGRMDISAHPFTSGNGDDVRITTRYDPNDLRPALFAAIHEGGHALYEQGYDPKHYGTPMAQAISLGYHESQSRLWENLVGRSRPFWEYYYPRLQKVFPKQLEKYDMEEFYRGVNLVRPSLIRVEADEVTYNLHILLRFEMEKDMIEGKLDPKEAPEVWNQKMDEYLGITPDTDSNGVLQDIHWSMGLMGYFPTYTLGNLYSAQIFHQAKKEIKDLDELIASGKLRPLRNWLRENIHRHGKRYTAEELTKRLTGEPLNEDYFINYLREKYSPIYGVKL